MRKLNIIKVKIWKMFPPKGVEPGIPGWDTERLKTSILKEKDSSYSSQPWWNY